MHYTQYHIVALLLALTLPLNIAAAQSDPLADLFANPDVMAEDAAVEPVAEAAEDAVEDAVIASDEYLADVSGLIATATEGGVTLSWDAVEGADAYTVYYSPVSIYDSEDGMYATMIELDNVTEYTVENLTASIEYFFAVTAENLTDNMGSEFYSDEVSATPLAAAEVAIEESAASSTTVDVAETEVIEDVATEEPLHGAAPDTLPQSGPLTGALLASAVAGAYAWRRSRR